VPSEVAEVVCGTIEVPASRTTADSGTITLPIAVFPSTSATPGIPVIYLDGGPGGSTLETIQYSYEDSIAPFLADRAYIAFDQRGTGLSEPSLACSETRAAELDLLDAPRDEEAQTAIYLGALEDCYNRLVGEGIDLSSYNSIESAADVNDIRQALGYDTLHLNGISYGTRLGLTLMRDFPEMIESVILDSPVPLQLNTSEELPESVSGAYDAFFAGCAADPECAAAYPTLEDDFYALVDQLNSDPLVFPVLEIFSGEEYDVWYDGESLKGTLFQTLYSNEIFPDMAKIIDQLQEGDTSELRWIEANFLASGEFISEGVYHSVRCNEEVPFYDAAVLASAPDIAPELADFFSDHDLIIEVCDLWAVDTAPDSENVAVSSDIPTLVLAGEYDPVTPFSYGEETMTTLSNAYYFAVPHVGHAVQVGGDCPRDITLAFLRDPSTEPDSSCIAEMAPPNFTVAGEIDTTITLEPFTADVAGAVISSVSPAEWESIGDGLFARGSSAADQTALVFQAIPAATFSVNEFVDLFAAQIGIAEVPAPELYTDDNGRDWDMYRVETSGLPTDMAVYSDSNFIYLVVLAMQVGEEDLWREPLFFPALSNMQVE